MKGFGIVLKYELKEYFTNKVFMGLTAVLVILGAAALFLPRFVDMSGFTGVKVVGEGEDASDADQEEQELFLYFFGYRLTDDLPPQLWRFFCGDGRWGDERHMKGRNKGAASIKRMRLCYDKPIKKTINTITGST